MKSKLQGKAVIFDMDGLMIESEHDQSRAYIKLLNEYGVKPDYRKEGVIQIIGTSARDNLNRFRTQYNINATIDELLARKREIDGQILDGGVTIMQGLRNLLSDIEHKPAKKAIASSSSKNYIEKVINHLKLRNYFDAITSGDEVNNGKPAPDIFLEAARKLGIAPTNCIVLEDAESGVTAASAAGMKVIAVPNRFTHKHDFDKADLIVQSLTALSWQTIEDLLGKTRSQPANA